MNPLTAESISFFYRELSPNAYLHPTSVSYILSLLTPYSDTILPASIESITAWIPSAFSGTLAIDALKALNSTSNNTTDETRKYHLFALLIRTLIISVVNTWTLHDTKDDTILPWNIQHAISITPDLSSAFSIPPDSTLLAVTVTIGPQLFTHMLSLEFTVGLIVFSLATKNDFNITLFGSPFTTDYIYPVHTDQVDELYSPALFNSCFHLYPDIISKHYSVVVAKELYSFYTPDFMHGFSTGSQWANLDHHKFWSKLIQYVTLPDSNVTQLNIDF